MNGCGAADIYIYIFFFTACSDERIHWRRVWDVGGRRGGATRGGVGLGGGGGVFQLCLQEELSLDLKQSSDSAVITSVLGQSVPVWYGPEPKPQNRTYIPSDGSSQVTAPTHQSLGNCAVCFVCVCFFFFGGGGGVCVCVCVCVCVFLFGGKIFRLSFTR